MSSTFSITGQFVDLFQQTVYPAEVVVSKGKINTVSRISDCNNPSQNYILPGFIDSHVHIESSMLVPSEFARLAVVHGTVATVSDPHEIANVCGMAGVEFMIENGKKVPFKFYFGAPSCVPATFFETAGAWLDAEAVEKLLQRDDIKYLSEMMNFPGVLKGDEEVIKKIAAAHRLGKPVDGHAPGLRGMQAQNYIKRISFPIDAKIPPAERFEGATDHECFTYEEALEKLRFGMKIIIREGSAAKNFDALINLVNDWPDKIMFGSDDTHPDSLVRCHINRLCARAVVRGIDIFKILRAACVNPVLHYKLDVGLLKIGDPADFIVVKDLKNFEVLQTFINGELVAENGKSLIKPGKAELINNFLCNPKNVKDFVILWNGEKEIPVIEALDGQLITQKLFYKPKVVDGNIVSDTERDILKIVVVNRYADAPPAKAFVKNFRLTKGAIASSVAHDSHNIVAVGVDDNSICRAVNLIIQHKGGISAVAPQSLTQTQKTTNRNEMILHLPVGGLMSNEDGYIIAARYEQLDQMAKNELGSTLSSPFMTLSFMALLVIPHIKLSDKGLFDVDKFEFIG